MGILNRIKDGLKKTRDSVSAKLEGVITSFGKIDDDFYEELEETLILCDIGPAAADSILKQLRNSVKEQKIKEPARVKELLARIIAGLLSFENTGISYPCVMLIVGVNGVGKTTTIGKLAKRFVDDGKKVYIAAADTFRAAAAEQLTEWSQRAGAKIIKYGEGADPAAVVYDAIDSAKHGKADVLICDTAGRLHNKKNLMNELEKINRVIDKAYPEADKKTYLVVDAATGQNAVQQAREFAGVTDLSGVILTKLDGTAKGGIVCAISAELKLPVVYVGVGEALGDIQPFDADEFAGGLF